MTRAALTAALLAAGCTAPPDFCEQPTRHVYDPIGSDRLDAWPDEHWTVADDASPTGLRVDIRDAPWFDPLPELLWTVADGVNGMSGFGTQAELHVRFTDLIATPPGVDASTSDPGLRLYDLSTEPPTRVPYEARLGLTGQQLLILPARPLQPQTEHALVITDQLPDAEGRCIAPSRAMRGVLDRSTDTLGDRVRPIRRLLRNLDLDPGEVTALLRFTTHGDDGAFLAAAATARDAEVGWTSAPTCVDDGGLTRCDLAFDPYDFRGEDQRVRDTATARARVPVSVWRPDGVAQPPVVIYGHGLGQSRLDGDEVAALLLPLGVAVVGVDAVLHGDHPSASGSPDPTGFLGLDLSDGLRFDLGQLRGSFDQSVLDRVQLAALLRADPDLDGDGVADLDPDRMAYLGISLGGILGAGTLMASDDIDAAVLAVAGGNLSSVVQDTQLVGPLRPLLVQLAGGEEQLEAVFSLLQTSIDPSDPTAWAARTLQDRPFGGSPPHVLLPVSTLDEVVPPSAGRALARAFGLPHARPWVEPVPGLSDAGPAPFAQNHPAGVTAALFQFDRMTTDGELTPSRHMLPRSDEFQHQLDAWLRAWLEDGVPRVVDPYADLGTPPLPDPG